MTPIEILTAARDLIADAENWTQHAWARNADGTKTSAESDDAVCWCAGGAIVRVTPASQQPAFPAAICDDAARRIKGLDLVLFNDATDTTHLEVLAMFDDAIGAERERWR